MTQPAASSSSAAAAGLPVTVDVLAAEMVLLYTSAEQQLLADMARLSDRQVALAIALRREAQRIATALRLRSWPLAQQIAAIAATRGAASASAELRQLVQGSPRLAELLLRTPTSTAAANAIGLDLAARLDSTLPGILRFADDAYRAATVAGSLTALTAHGTPALAQQAAWRRLTERGITGFTDRTGRQWNLASYVEMATRTAVQRAYNAAHLDRMLAVGIDQFTVSDDGHPCPLCKPWQGRVLTRSGPSPTIDEARTAGLFHPNCFPGGTLVSSPSCVRAADSRWYEGQLVVIHTAGGQELSVTPNHPVLTPEGWVAAGQLVVGQNVLRHDRDRKWMHAMGPHDQLYEAEIGKVFDALRQSSPVRPVTVPAATEQFHGDGGQSEVKVVLTGRLLEDYGVDAQSQQMLGQGAFLRGRVRGSDLLRHRALEQIRLAARHATDSIVGGGRQRGAFCWRHALESSLQGVAATDLNAPLEHPSTDGGLSDSEGGRDLALSLAGQVTLDEIVDIGARQHAGHVYNLQTGDGWYVAESIVVHNCRHTLIAYLPGVSKVPAPTPWTAADQARYDATQQLRALERRVRDHKRAAAGARTVLDAKRARTRQLAVQAQIRAHVDRHGLVRRTRREQLNLGNR